jgi:ribosome hibernation promoting factor
MQFSVTFRHMEPSEAIKEYCREKLDKIKKYFPDPISAHVVFSTERGYQHVVDVHIQLHNGLLIKGAESTEDMYSSIDLVIAKIERQVRRYHDKIRGHKSRVDLSTIPVQHSVISADIDGRSGNGQGGPSEVSRSAGSSPAVIKTDKYVARQMEVNEAVMQLNLLGDQFLVFRNAKNGQVNVLYRRDDGDYGLIETGPAPQ